MKVAIIGAGGYIFPLRLIQDILSWPELGGCTLSLMDIALERLERTAGAARRLVEMHGLSAQIEATTSRREALDGASYVIVAFQVGGLEAYRLDVTIPRDYGVDQTVGDTLGPGGVFRGLRTVAVLEEMAAEMRELCPNALVLQYANPMAVNSWALNELGVPNVGLCHSVQGTSKMLAETLGVPYDELTYRAAGINHQAWFLEFKRGEEDLLPRLRETMERVSFGDRDETDELGPKRERVRTDIMRLTGYFQTESPHHASEYLPWFRKTDELTKSYLPNRWDYYAICVAHDEAGQVDEELSRAAGGLCQSEEYAGIIVRAMETNTPAVINGNVRNTGLITNLPEGCCVEVPCLVDRNGVQPTFVGDLPPIAAAVNRTNVNVQELATRAALTGDRSLVVAAVALDPLTSAQCTLPQIREMVDRMLAAEARWLPRFARA